LSLGPVAVTDAEPADLPAVQAIYASFVETTAITFDLEPYDLGYWERLLAGLDRDAGHEFLVARSGGSVVGYAKTGEWRPKGAYRSTAETSIYVADDAQGMGVGSLLYTELITRSRANGLKVLVAGATEPNPASTALHLAHGFERVGTFTGVGTKFGRSWDVTWFQLVFAG
jgi:phosphinothricin acetyltransferase